MERLWVATAQQIDAAPVVGTYCSCSFQALVVCSEAIADMSATLARLAEVAGSTGHVNHWNCSAVVAPMDVAPTWLVRRSGLSTHCRPATSTRYLHRVVGRNFFRTFICCQPMHGLPARTVATNRISNTITSLSHCITCLITPTKAATAISRKAIVVVPGALIRSSTNCSK